MILNKFEAGDYQTPGKFCDIVIELLKQKYNLNPKVVIEPTMGVGNFLVASRKKYNHARLIGIEINNEYIESFKKYGIDAKLFNENIFQFDFTKVKDEIASLENEVLFVGNPPWVTNSDLSSLGSFNLPFKTNFKKNKGLEAITGKGNFDICEYILLELMSKFRDFSNCYFAFLCKEIVGKNIIRDLEKYDFNLEFADMYKFDASSVFGVSCDAVLFVTKVSKNSNLSTCNCFDINKPFELKNVFGWKNNKFISNLENYIFDFDGKSQLVWRQGIKHDCSKIMEFKLINGELINGNNEKVNLSKSNFLYPLVKSSGFKNRIIDSFDRYVIVTQNYVREDTTKLKEDANLYNYLMENIHFFEKRKSSIYKNTPPFSIFGVGDYSFYKYKIGISGFYKIPRFSFLKSSKPVMVDDTCYFIGTNDEKEAIMLMAILDNEKTYSFLESISFKNSKRPFTKDVLQRLDLIKMFEYYKDDMIIEYSKKVFMIELSVDDIHNYICKLKNNSYGK